MPGRNDYRTKKHRNYKIQELEFSHVGNVNLELLSLSAEKFIKDYSKHDRKLFREHRMAIVGSILSAKKWETV